MMSSEKERFDEAFSHRPLGGLSVGVRIDGDQAIVAAAFQRPCDQFSRKNALTVLRGRMSRPFRTRVCVVQPVTLDANADPQTYQAETRYVRGFKVPVGTTAKQFMRIFRQSFRSGGEDGGEEDAKDSIGRTRSRETQSRIIFTQLAPYVANEMYTISNAGAPS